MTLVGHIILLVFLTNVFDVEGFVVSLVPRGPAENNEALEILKNGIYIGFDIQEEMTSLIESKLRII